MMRRYQTVLSGSAALRVVDAAEWWPGDLDFYCPEHLLVEVIQWFRRQGYKVVHSMDQPYRARVFHNFGSGRRPPRPESSLSLEFKARYSAESCMKKVYTLKHKRHRHLSINIIQSRSRSALAPLAFFHSSLVMNFISAEGVFSAYPSLTLNQQGKSIT
jgi:hypothetical protein